MENESTDSYDEPDEFWERPKTEKETEALIINKTVNNLLNMSRNHKYAEQGE